MTRLKQYLKNSIKLGLALSIIAFCASCQNKPASQDAKKDPAQLFLKSFNETLKLSTPLYASSRLTGNTLWAYIATDKEIVTLDRARQQGTFNQEQAFLQVKGNYKQETFAFYYSIEKLKDFPETQFTEEPNSAGVTENYTDLMQEISNKAYSSLADIIYHTGKEVEFFVICIADIKKGIEVITVMNRQDLEKYIVGITTSEEFHNRTLLKIRGSEQITNDKTGRHLNYKSISLTNFIIEVSNQQIKQAFMKLPETQKTGANTEELILQYIYKMVRIYEFSKYYQIELENISTGDKKTVSAYELEDKFKEPQV